MAWTEAYASGSSAASPGDLAWTWNLVLSWAHTTGAPTSVTVVYNLDDYADIGWSLAGHTPPASGLEAYVDAYVGPASESNSLYQQTTANIGSSWYDSGDTNHHTAMVSPTWIVSGGSEVNSPVTPITTSYLYAAANYYQPPFPGPSDYADAYAQETISLISVTY